MVGSNPASATRRRSSKLERNSLDLTSESTVIAIVQLKSLPSAFKMSKSVAIFKKTNRPTNHVIDIRRQRRKRVVKEQTGDHLTSGYLQSHPQNTPIRGVHGDYLPTK